MAAPALILLAGPNGAGKSTLYDGIIRPRFPDVPFVNADNHERAELQNIADPLARSEPAREWADTERAPFLSERRSFATETVFSHESKIALIEEAKAAGFEVLLLIVCCDDVDLLVRRVAWHGKHAVPVAKIRERYPRTLVNLSRALPLADIVHLYDNAGYPDAAGETASVHRLIAIVEGGVVAERTQEPLPNWACRVLAGARNAEGRSLES